MNEKLFRVKVADQAFPLLYNLAAQLDFEERFEDVGNLVADFVGPQDEKGDSKEVKASKKAERKKADLYFKRQLPWMISTLAKHGIKRAVENGEDVPAAPSEEWVSDHMSPGQLPQAMLQVIGAFTYGCETEHKKGDNREVDVVLEMIESKNGEGAAE